jgi:hypothetical protein
MTNIRVTERAVADRGVVGDKENPSARVLSNQGGGGKQRGCASG